MKQPEDGGEAGAATTNTDTVMKWFENKGFGFITLIREVWLYISIAHS